MARVTLEFVVDDKGSVAVRRAKGEVAGLGDQMDRTRARSRDFGTSLDSAGTRAAALGRHLVGLAATVGVGLGFREAIRQSATFESSLARLQIESGETEETIAGIGRTIRRMGVESGEGMDQTAAALRILRRETGDTEEALARLPLVLDLADAAEQDAASSARALGAVLRGLEGQIRDPTEAADLLAFVAAKLGGEAIPGFSDAIQGMGQPLQRLGIGLRDVVPLMVEMQRIGAEPRQLRTLIGVLANDSEKLQAVLGGSADFSDIFATIQRLAQAPAEALTPILGPGANQVFANLAARLPVLRQMQEEFDGIGGSAQRASDIIDRTPEEKFDILKEGVRDLAVQFAGDSGLLDALTRTVDQLNAVDESGVSVAQTLGTAVAGAVIVVADAIRGWIMLLRDLNTLLGQTAEGLQSLLPASAAAQLPDIRPAASPPRSLLPTGQVTVGEMTPISFDLEKLKALANAVKPEIDAVASSSDNVASAFGLAASNAEKLKDEARAALDIIRASADAQMEILQARNRSAENAQRLQEQLGMVSPFGAADADFARRQAELEATRQTIAAEMLKTTEAADQVRLAGQLKATEIELGGLAKERALTMQVITQQFADAAREAANQRGSQSDQMAAQGDLRRVQMLGQLGRLNPVEVIQQEFQINQQLRESEAARLETEIQRLAVEDQSLQGFQRRLQLETQLAGIQQQDSLAAGEADLQVQAAQQQAMENLLGQSQQLAGNIAQIVGLFDQDLGAALQRALGIFNLLVSTAQSFAAVMRTIQTIQAAGSLAGIFGGAAGAGAGSSVSLAAGSFVQASGRGGFDGGAAVKPTINVNVPQPTVTVYVDGKRSALEAMQSREGRDIMVKTNREDRSRSGGQN